MKGFLDLQVAWFIPLYRRVLTVLVCLVGAVFEAVQGTVFWAMLFGAAGIYCAYQFFVVFDPKPPDPEDDNKGSET